MAFLKRAFAWKKRGVVPPESMQENGLTAGTKLPADYLNEQWTATAEAIEELQEKAVEKTTFATSSAFGLVKNGTNIDNASGVLSVKNATTSAKGVVQLDDTTTSTSTSVAATARVVKEVADSTLSLSSKVAATETTLNNKITSLQDSFRAINEVELPKYYKNGTGTGSLNVAPLITNGIKANSTSSPIFLGSALGVSVTDENGFNSGNTVIYMPLRADFFYGNRLISDATRHLYFGTDGNVRVTSRGTSTIETIIYRAIQASSFDVASSYTYKQDMTEMTRSALDIVDVLKIHEYRMKSDVEAGIFDNWKIGLIAEYSPQVSTDENMKIDTYKMQSLNWKATQELHQLVRGHEYTIEMQQAEINEMKQEIAEIKALLTNN